MSNEHDSILILGIGSPFGADRVGWEAVELLRVEPALARARLEVSDRPGAGLLTLLQGVDTAILIDAVLSDSRPGTLHHLDPATLARGTRTSNHGFGVADALALGRVLGNLPPRLHLLGISAAGDHPPVLDAGALVALVLAMLRETTASSD